MNLYKLATYAPPNVIDYYNSIDPLSNLVFSLCYAEDGGYMSLGGYNTKFHDPNDEIKYIPYTTPNEQYRINLFKISVNYKLEIQLRVEY